MMNSSAVCSMASDVAHVVNYDYPVSWRWLCHSLGIPVIVTQPKPDAPSKAVLNNYE